MVKKINKRGQSLTIWIILALALVAAMALFFTIEIGPEISIGSDKELDAKRVVQLCVEDTIQETIENMIPHGGFIEDSNSIEYNRINISYLCLNKGNYLPCISQHPNYINDLKKEIIENSEDKIEQCFQNMKTEAEKRNFDVVLGEMNIDIGFAINRIFVSIDREIKISKKENAETFDEFKFEIVNPLYNLALIASEISNEEAKNCYFEYVGYNILNKQTDIRKTTLDEGTKIYSIKDKKSGKEMNIAIRGCAIPAGI